MINSHTAPCYWQ